MTNTYLIFVLVEIFKVGRREQKQRMVGKGKDICITFWYVTYQYFGEQNMYGGPYNIKFLKCTKIIFCTEYFWNQSEKGVVVSCYTSFSNWRFSI